MCQSSRRQPGFLSRFCVVLFRSLEDIEDVRREVQIMHHLSGHENITKLRGAYEDRHHVHLVS